MSKTASPTSSSSLLKAGLKTGRHTQDAKTRRGHIDKELQPEKWVDRKIERGRETQSDAFFH